MRVAMKTLRPGEITAAELEGQDPKALPEWVAVVDHVFDRLPTVAGRLSKLGPISPGGHIIALWIVVAVAICGGVFHVMGDGTLRAKVERTEAKVDRTECYVEWLVERAVAEDRGEPPPPFSPQGCRQ